MPSDLNLKKSWNPKLIKNQERVWKKEREVLQEHKKIKLREEEIRDFKAKNDLIALGKVTDSSKIKDHKTSWMYKEIGNCKNDYDNEGATLVNDALLLGKKRVNDFITSNTYNKKDLKQVSSLDNVISMNKSHDKPDSQIVNMSAVRNPNVLPIAVNSLDNTDPMFDFKLLEIKRKKQCVKQKEKYSEKLKYRCQSRDGNDSQRGISTSQQRRSFLHHNSHYYCRGSESRGSEELSWSASHKSKLKLKKSETEGVD